jgi:putative transcriptional regulator
MTKNIFPDSPPDMQGDTGHSLTGDILIAMPSMRDPRFTNTVIFMCSHSNEGAMGLVINRALDSLTFPDMLDQLGILPARCQSRVRVHFGGPVESERGFVLHSSDYIRDATLAISETLGLTATIDILKDMAGGDGPEQTLLALGYAGWAPGQLDMEIRANGWLHVASDNDLVFGQDLAGKWERAMAKLGVDPRMLSGTAGHA